MVAGSRGPGLRCGFRISGLGFYRAQGALHHRAGIRIRSRYCWFDEGDSHDGYKSVSGDLGIATGHDSGTDSVHTGSRF